MMTPLKKLPVRIKLHRQHSKVSKKKYLDALSAARKSHLKEGATSAKPADGVSADE